MIGVSVINDQQCSAHPDLQSKWAVRLEEAFVPPDRAVCDVAVLQPRPFIPAKKPLTKNLGAGARRCIASKNEEKKAIKENKQAIKLWLL